MGILHAKEYGGGTDRTEPSAMGCRVRPQYGPAPLDPTPSSTEPARSSRRRIAIGAAILIAFGMLASLARECRGEEAPLVLSGVPTAAGCAEPRPSPEGNPLSAPADSWSRVCAGRGKATDGRRETAASKLPAHRVNEASFSKPFLIYGAAAGLDFYSTRYLMARGGREQILPTQSAGGQAAIKAGAALLLASADYRLQRGGHRTVAKVARIVIPVFWSAAAVHNFNAARRAQ